MHVLAYMQVLDAKALSAAKEYMPFGTWGGYVKFTQPTHHLFLLVRAHHYLPI